MDTRRSAQVAVAALAIGIAATAVIVIVVGLGASITSEQPPDTSGAAQERPIPSDVFDSERSGEELPPGFRQLLGRDQIAPVYDPVYVPRDQVDWPADSLVLGVAGTKTFFPERTRRCVMASARLFAPRTVGWMMAVPTRDGRAGLRILGQASTMGP